MKILKKSILVLMAFAAVSLTSCSKSDDGGDDPQGGVGTFSAKVDGATYTPIQESIAAQISGSGAAQALAVSAGTMDSENLQIIIVGYDGVGTYDLNMSNIGTYSYLPDPSNPDPSTVVIYSTVNGQASNGQIKVSSDDGNVVKGTFSFTAYNLSNPSQSVSVTDGQFNIKLR